MHAISEVMNVVLLGPWCGFQDSSISMCAGKFGRLGKLAPLVFASACNSRYHSIDNEVVNREKTETRCTRSN